MTQNELLISIVRIYIMREKQCNFIRNLLYHYKLYFLIKKIQQYDEYNELKPIPFFVWRHLIVRYIIYLCAIIYIMYKIDIYLDLETVSILDLPIPYIAFIAFIYLIYTKRTYYSNKYYDILSYNWLLLKKMPQYNQCIRIIDAEERDKKKRMQKPYKKNY